jgi:hypothetical protein
MRIEYIFQNCPGNGRNGRAKSGLRGRLAPVLGCLVRSRHQPTFETRNGNEGAYNPLTYEHYANGHEQS